MHELYREHLLEHYRRPRNAAPLANPDAVSDAYNPLCGDWVRVELKFGPRSRIAAVTFVARGCVIATASASLLSEAVKGKSAAQARRIDYNALCRLIGVTVSPGRSRCAMLSLVALRQALGKAVRRKS